MVVNMKRYNNLTLVAAAAAIGLLGIASACSNLDDVGVVRAATTTYTGSGTTSISPAACDPNANSFATSGTVERREGVTVGGVAKIGRRVTEKTAIPNFTDDSDCTTLLNQLYESAGPQPSEAYVFTGSTDTTWYGDSDVAAEYI